MQWDLKINVSKKVRFQKNVKRGALGRYLHFEVRTMSEMKKAPFVFYLGLTYHALKARLRSFFSFPPEKNTSFLR